MSNLQYIGARYVPKYYENSNDPTSMDWESGVAYEAITVVTYQSDTYTSKIPVPASVGSPDANPTYWAKTADFNAALVGLTNRVTSIENDIGSTPLPTTAQTITGAIDEIDNRLSDNSIPLWAFEKSDSFTFTRTSESTLQEFLDAALNAHNTHLATTYGTGYASIQRHVDTSGRRFNCLAGDVLQPFPYTNHSWSGVVNGAYNHGIWESVLIHDLGSNAKIMTVSFITDGVNGSSVTLRADQEYVGTSQFVANPSNITEIPTNFLTDITFVNDIYKKL